MAFFHFVSGSRLGAAHLLVLSLLAILPITCRPAQAASAAPPGAADLTDKITIGKVEADRLVFAFSHGGGGLLTFPIRSTASVDSDLTCSFVLKERAGAIVRQSTQDVALPAQAEIKVDYPVDPDKLRYAVYDLTVAVAPKGGAGSSPLAQTTVALGVISSSKLRKARDGEFLYGLDPSLGPISDNPALLEWTRIMGTDILRNPFMLWEAQRPQFDMVNEVMKRAPIYRQYGLKYTITVDPEPPGPKAAWRLSYEALKQKKIDFINRIGQVDRDDARFWELGNEPDIGFYNGPKQQYAADYLEFYKAIKASDPPAMVFNGGFAYDTGNITTILKAIGPQNLDAVAYHAHGPGVGAERRAYVSIRKIAGALGFPSTTKFLDTESGMDATGPSQEIIQATTAIEKLVFAQAHSEPFFMWFRLRFEQEDSYTTVKLSDNRQPRPAVLSYRATVEALRGLKYAGNLDFGVNGLECYVFKSPVDNSCCCVLWMDLEAPAPTGSVDLAIAPGSADVSNLAELDMFGNPAPLTPTGDGRVHLTVGARPIFVKWSALDPAFKIAVGRRDVEIAPTTTATVGRTTVMPINVHNASKQPWKATLEVEAHTKQDIRVTPNIIPVTLAPGETRSVAVSLVLPAWKNSEDFPHAWRVFLDCDPHLDPAAFSTMPDTVQARSGAPISWTSAYLINNQIDLRTLYASSNDKAGQVDFPEKTPALLFAEIRSDTARSINVGASADWWMDWAVNGREVYTTLPGGNGGRVSIDSHIFKINLKQGENLIAVKVLSGSQGWLFVAGGPSDLAGALSEGADHLDVKLVGSRKNVVASNSTTLIFQRPVPWLTGDVANEKLRDWRAMPPMATITGDQVTNLYYRDPDTSRWWKGDRDLSATVWLRQNATRLFVAVDVTDDIDVPAQTTADFAASDHVNVSLAGGDGIVHEWAVGRVADTVQVQLVKGSRTAGSVEATVERDDGHTFYTIAIPKSVISGDQPKMNVIVTDNDAGYRKQYGSLSPFGLDAAEPAPDKWRTFVLK